MSRDRRLGRRAPPRIAAPLTLAQRFSALFATGDSWFDATSYTVDGVSGKVFTFVDRKDPSHFIAQPASANQVVIPTADAALGGVLSASFVTASANRYVSNRSISSFRFLHDGTGCEVLDVYVPLNAGANQAVWATRANASSTTETGTVRQMSGTVHRLVVSNGTASVPVVAASGSYVDGVGSYSDIFHSTPSTPDYGIYNKTVLGNNGTYTGVPAVGDSQGTFTLGTSVSGTTGGTFRWHATYMFKRVLTAAERQVAQNYITLNTGL